jgi:hypothetical protein
VNGKMILDWLIDRARKKAVESIRWRVFFAILAMGGLGAIGWLVATYIIGG